MHARTQHPPETVRAFFSRSSDLDYMCLRPLSHITTSWEATWDGEEQRYAPEEDSFAEDLNHVIDAITAAARPVRYHDDEDVLAENVLREMKWPIQKKGGRWIGADYGFILEQGAFRDWKQERLVSAATGRVHAALDFGQKHFDDMEEGHMNMLAQLVTIIIYHRYCAGTSFFTDTDDDAPDDPSTSSA